MQVIFSKQNAIDRYAYQYTTAIVHFIISWLHICPVKDTCHYSSGKNEIFCHFSTFYVITLKQKNNSC